MRNQSPESGWKKKGQKRRGLVFSFQTPFYSRISRLTPRESARTGDKDHDHKRNVALARTKLAERLAELFPLKLLEPEAWTLIKVWEE